MMHLVLTICAMANLSHCQHERVNTDARMPLECFAAASEWAAAHPAWRVVRFRCGPVERDI